jgi:hypothetical protein
MGGLALFAFALRWDPTAPTSRSSPVECLGNFLVATITNSSLKTQLHCRDLAGPVGALKFACEEPIDGFPDDVRHRAATAGGEESQRGLLVVVEVDLRPSH